MKLRNNEKPKYIKSVGNIGSSVHIELGSKEEAEKAVVKLNAWERLKEAGFEFLGITITDGLKICFGFSSDKEDDVTYGLNKDLNLLFGGKK